jgi:methionyl-tRNA formyltransferase
VAVGRDGTLTVAAADGWVRLTRVQAAGRAEEAAEAWAHGQGLRAGGRMPAGE